MDEVHRRLEIEVHSDSDLESESCGKFIAFCETRIIGEESQFSAFPCVTSTKTSKVTASNIVAKGVGVAGDEGEAVADALLGVCLRGEAHYFIIRLYSYNIIRGVAPIDGTAYEVAASVTTIRTSASPKSPSSLGQKRNIFSRPVKWL